MQISIRDLEAYLYRHYRERGNEQSLFMKLVEEVGETAEIINKKSGIKASEDCDLQAELGKELADIIHYVVAIAAINRLDLDDIILSKDRQAAAKYHHEINLEQFLSLQKDSRPNENE